jgi:D-alanyl-D-alanine carboxypeptidase
VGVHNFLTDSWTEQDRLQARSGGSVEKGLNEAPTSPSLTATGPSGSAHSPGVVVSPPPGSTAAAAPANASANPADVARPTLPSAPGNTVPVNPVVACYTDSLAARGFGADNQGFIVATLKGQVLAEHNADRLFNPASVTKVATSLTAISRLGPDFKFKTALYTDGTLDRSTGTLHGSLYVVGSGDPAFFYENAMMIADKLNQSGIRTVDGNLVVLGQFFFNFSASREASAKAFRQTLDAQGWPAAAKNAYPRYLAIRSAEEHANEAAAKAAGTPYKPAVWPSSPPSLTITGQTITDPAVNTSRLHLLAIHTSLPLVRVLKGLNDFSNNWMATMIGNLVGGPDAVEKFLQTELGFKEDEVRFATPSGLGANAISPRSTVNMLRKLIVYLDSKGLGLEDVLPIAGVDAGTLEKRFNDAFRGSVVAKTGTLSGVSALAGVAYTRGKGPLLFVIYNRGGSPHAFRPVQDETIKKVITLFGGPASLHYTPPAAPRVTERSDPGSQAQK